MRFTAPGYFVMGELEEEVLFYDSTHVTRWEAGHFKYKY